MNKPNKAGLSCFTGCGTILLVVILCGYLLILSMCHVPKETYKPYMEAGSKYYQTILGVSPTLSHDSQYADEAGGFSIDVKFTEEQMKTQKLNCTQKEIILLVSEGQLRKLTSLVYQKIQLDS